MAILLKIAEDADQDADWRELALSLGDFGDKKDIVTRMEKFLQVAKAMRDAEVLGKNEVVYAVSYPIIAIADHRMTMHGAHPALDAMSEKIRVVERKHGLGDGEFWPHGEGPAEYQQLNKQYDRVVEEVIAATFDEYGEPKLGAMYRHEYDRFNGLFEEGRQQFFRSRKGRH